LTSNVYERVADALDSLPNGFPRTPSHIELRILKKIFSPEEAEVASRLSGSLEPAEAVAKKIGLSVEETRERLNKMAKRGLVWCEDLDGSPSFRLAPFVVGIYESQLETMDHELAHMIEDYFVNGGAVGIMKPQPALHRVVPAQRAVKSELILPYDDVKAILLRSKSFGLRDCICRVQRKYLGHECQFPMKTCLFFSDYERRPHRYTVSKEEALAFLDKAEEIGLVHTVSNIMKGIGYVCNCCGCCCGILRGINDWGIENSVAHANYTAKIDPDTCVNCGTCRTRCQVHAITEQNGISIVNKKKCIGCGLCVTGCPNDVAKLERKPEKETIAPPQDFETWEHERLHNRGCPGS
jgi:electron transport complex protein RnfB